MTEKPPEPPDNDEIVVLEQRLRELRHARANARRSQTQRRRFSDPEVRKRMSDASRKAWTDPEVRKRMSDASRKAWAVKTNEFRCPAEHRKYYTKLCTIIGRDAARGEIEKLMRAQSTQEIARARPAPKRNGGSFVLWPKIKRKPPAAKPSGNAAILSEAIRFLESRDFIVRRIGDNEFKVDHKIVDRTGLLTIANRHRATIGKPPFVLAGEAA